MNSHQIPPLPNGPTPRQLSVRRRASRLYLHAAVRLAAHAFFRFTHRAENAEALWSHGEGVWLGSQTFLHWAMCDAGIDVPWVVGEATDAPETADELRETVRAELIAYWAEQLAALPRKSTPVWCPLP
jgi:hypothetical protein